MAAGNPMPQDTAIEAQFADGFVLSETEQQDVSLFDQGKNTLSDVLSKKLEAQHGRMTRFSVYWHGKRYDVNWSTVPLNGRPIRFRDGQASLNTATGEQTFDWVACRFGYQYNDLLGANKQVIQEL